MISRNTSIFIIIAACYSFLTQVGIQVYWINRGSEFHLTAEGLISLAVQIFTPVSIALLAGSLVRETSERRKLFAIFVTIITAIGLGIRLYYRIQYFSGSFDSQYASNVLWYFVQVVLTLLYPVALLLMGIALLGTNTGRIKKAAVWLIAGALISLFELISYKFPRWISYGFEYNTTWDTVLDIATLLEAVLPIALLILGVALYKRFDAHTPIIPAAVTEETMLDEVVPAEATSGNTTSVIPTVMNWLANFLLISIPFAGIVLLIIWSVNHENRVRRNWAIASFLISIFATALNIFVYLPFLLDLDLENIDFTIPITILIAMIITGSMLIYNYAQQRPHESKRDDSNPSVMLWISNFIIVGIPIIGLICLIIWATEPKNLLIQRWAKARLIWMGIMLVFGLFIYTIMLEMAKMKPYVYFQF